MVLQFARNCGRSWWVGLRRTLRRNEAGFWAYPRLQRISLRCRSIRSTKAFRHSMREAADSRSLYRFPFLFVHRSACSTCRILPRIKFDFPWLRHLEGMGACPSSGTLASFFIESLLGEGTSMIGSPGAGTSFVISSLFGTGYSMIGFSGTGTSFFSLPGLPSGSSHGSSGNGSSDLFWLLRFRLVHVWSTWCLWKFDPKDV